MININATLIVQLINLLVLIYILNQIMYKPIRRIVAERAAKIKAGNDEAERLEQEAQATQQDYEQKLRQGRVEVRQRLGDLFQENELQAAAILEKAEAKAKDHSTAMQAEIQSQIAESRGQIKAEAAKVAQDLTRQLMGREVS